MVELQPSPEYFPFFAVKIIAKPWETLRQVVHQA